MINNKKIVGIVQARLGSTRLPNKMLLSLHGSPLIEWVVRRVGKAELLDDLVVAVPDTRKDDVLAAYLEEIRVKVFRGPENDVLKRFYLAAQLTGADHIVRVCADNPLISGAEIDNLIRFYTDNPCDYAYNHIPRGNRYPDGLGAEIFPFQLLEKLDKEAVLPAHREHCVTFIHDNPELFSIKTFDPPDERIACPELKLDVDTFEDFSLLALKNIAIDTPDVEIVRIFKEQ